MMKYLIVALLTCAALALATGKHALAQDKCRPRLSPTGAPNLDEGKEVANATPIPEVAAFHLALEEKYKAEEREKEALAKLAAHEQERIDNYYIGYFAGIVSAVLMAWLARSVWKSSRAASRSV